MFFMALLIGAKVKKMQMSAIMVSHYAAILRTIITISRLAKVLFLIIEAKNIKE